MNRGTFEISQLLFADDTAQVADLEEKLCRLVSEFGRERNVSTLQRNKVGSKCM